MKHLYPVILSGGIGARLWPLSRQDYPKQFLNLANGDQSLIQQTALRFPYTKPLIVCNQEHRFMAAAQMQEAGVEAEIMLEPAAKNTAPAAAVAAYYLYDKNPDAVMLICPSDHIIQNIEVFQEAVSTAYKAANSNKLVLLGIKPTAPETGYGYIKAADPQNDIADVQQFVEKPNQATAQQYLDAGNYYWNAGIFVFSVKQYIQELETHQPAMAAACKASVAAKHQDLDFIRLGEEDFKSIEGDSIDYAILEKTSHAAVVPVYNMGWSDIGSWQALWEVQPKNAAGNVLKGNVLTEDTQNSYIQTHPKQMVATLGVKDLTVVVTKDAVLIADSSRSQETKTIVNQLKGQAETQQHTRVYRPWGTYEAIDEGRRYQVKRITVNPGQKLSVQKHFHRAEHWTVVSGTALVHKDNEELMLTENESAYLPIGCIHSLENPGKIPLTIIEVQVGAYVGEDDIVRLADNYGREG